MYDISSEKLRHERENQYWLDLEYSEYLKEQEEHEIDQMLIAMEKQFVSMCINGHCSSCGQQIHHENTGGFFV